jgi:prophage maintenance system killer protein
VILTEVKQVGGSHRWNGRVQELPAGNKRTGANAAITFLLINDWEPGFTEDELVDLVLSVASGVMSKSALTEKFEACCRPASDLFMGKLD